MALSPSLESHIDRLEPIGDNKMRWPGRQPYSGAFYYLFPSSEAFWQSPPDTD